MEFMDNCYRDRETHLNILVPRLREVFEDTAEIIVVEQNDNEPFLRGQLFNVGAKHARGDVLVFHDVDHYPVNVSYEPEASVFLPVKRVVYVDNNLKELPIEEVPSGYRHFKDGVDDDFFGGVEVFERDAFWNINGFNSFYRGWGLEDADLRERIKYYNLSVKRGNGNFYALQHTDSFPGINNHHFQGNQSIFQRWSDFLFSGITTQSETIEVKRNYLDTDLWIRATNFFVIRDLQNYWAITEGANQ